MNANMQGILDDPVEILKNRDIVFQGKDFAWLIVVCLLVAVGSAALGMNDSIYLGVIFYFGMPIGCICLALVLANLSGGEIALGRAGVTFRRRNTVLKYPWQVFEEGGVRSDQIYRIMKYRDGKLVASGHCAASLDEHGRVFIPGFFLGSPGRTVWMIQKIADKMEPGSDSKCSMSKNTQDVRIDRSEYLNYGKARFVDSGTEDGLFERKIFSETGGLSNDFADALGRFASVSAWRIYLQRGFTAASSALIVCGLAFIAMSLVVSVIHFGLDANEVENNLIEALYGSAYKGFLLGGGICVLSVVLDMVGYRIYRSILRIVGLIEFG